MENVKDAACHIPAVLDRVKREYIAKTYKVSSWNDPTDFLEQVAQRTGKLLKVGHVFCYGKYITNSVRFLFLLLLLLLFLSFAVLHSFVYSYVYVSCWQSCSHSCQTINCYSDFRRFYFQMCCNIYPSVCKIWCSTEELFGANFTSTSY